MEAKWLLSKPDDSSLTQQQLARVRKEAERALREAGALGVYPTPIDRILEVSKIEEVKEDVLNDSFIAKLRIKAGSALKRAISKVIGLFHATAGLIFLDQALHEVKKRFVRLHESGHGFLPWQRSMYAVVEDCDKALDPHASELFDREANVFASEVLFQLNNFRDMAEASAFDIMVPVKLSKTFDASIYASIRQYVSKNHRACVVIVLNKPELVAGHGFRASLRRVIQSDSFTAMFGIFEAQSHYTPDDDIGAMIPLNGRKASGKRNFPITDQNDVRHECIAESFTQSYQVFILIHAVKTLPTAQIVVAKAF